jgi:hypothetical protein
MLSADRLLDEARRASGLDAYGDMRFSDGLRVLVRSINEEAGLTAEAEARAGEEIIRNLVNRLRMHRDLQLHPEILEEEVLPPVFITSLPRTGSTKLHRMLAATGDFNALPFWMSYNFAPFPGPRHEMPDPRIAAAETYLQWMYRKAPLYQQAHPQYATEAEEELSLLDAGFNSLYRWAAQLNVPSYIEWVLSHAGVAALQDLRALIQYIQWQHFRGKQRRWVFKTPSLFGFESAYATVFPGTDFLVTHRLPEQTWSSVSALLCGVRALYSDADFSAVAAEMMLHNFAEALKGHLAWRTHYPPEKVMDVRFADVAGREIEVMRAIYAWLGMHFSASAEEKLHAWLAMDRERGHKRNTATLADYGVQPAALRERLSGYYRRYAEFL